MASNAALIHQAIAQHKAGNLAEAEKLYRLILSRVPLDADALINLSTLLSSRGEREQALQLLGKLVRAHPKLAYGHFAQGTVLMDAGRGEEALAAFIKALAIDPNLSDAAVNAAVVLNELGRYDEAHRMGTRVLAQRGQDARLQNTLGTSLQGLRRYDEALAAFGAAMALDPALVGAQWNKSLLHLMLGEYRQGLQLFECRWRTDFMKHLVRPMSVPLWLGEVPIAGKTLYVHHEQGFGDSLQYVRYLPLIVAQGGQVVLEVPPPLAGLMEASFPQPEIRIVHGEYQFPQVDYYCPIMSLPLALGITLETIPNAVPYLTVPVEKLQHWQGLLGPKTMRRIGLVWSGAAHHLNDKNRSIPLEMLQPVLQQNIEFHSLQNDIRARDLPFVGGMKLHMAELKDFADTAALIAQMDLVISVDTSVAHLAGGLGKETWLLLPEPADYRWLIDREDSPYYPTMRLFRQAAEGGWAQVIARVSEALQA